LIEIEQSNIKIKIKTMKKLLILTVFLTLGQLFGMAQNDTLSFNLNESRSKHIRELLNYRFKGGAGAFERAFFSIVDYTPEARKGCVVGTVIVSFTVDCNNNLGDLRLRNPLHQGIRDKLQEFYKSTEGQWNSCNDEKYTRFEIPVLFTIKGTETAAKGYLVVEGESPGFTCRSDAYFIEQFEKFKNKGKTKRALQPLDELIRRDPYNQNYYNWKRDLLSTD
jgi:hypothetical protein